MAPVAGRLAVAMSVVYRHHRLTALFLKLRLHTFILASHIPEHFLVLSLSHIAGASVSIPLPVAERPTHQILRNHTTITPLRRNAGHCGLGRANSITLMYARHGLNGNMLY